MCVMTPLLASDQTIGLVRITIPWNPDFRGALLLLGPRSRLGFVCVGKMRKYRLVMRSIHKRHFYFPPSAAMFAQDRTRKNSGDMGISKRLESILLRLFIVAGTPCFNKKMCCFSQGRFWRMLDKDPSIDLRLVEV